MYRIRVKSLQCCEREDFISLDVTSSTTIRDVKAEVEKQTNIGWLFQVLAHGNRKDLENWATLANCGVHSDTTLTLYDNTPWDLSKDKAENRPKRKGDGSSQGPRTKVPKTSPVFSQPQPQSPFSKLWGELGFPSLPQSTSARTSAPIPFSSTNPQPSVYSFGSFPSGSPAALTQPRGEKTSKESSGNYCSPSISGDANTDDDTMPPPTTPSLTSSSTFVLRSPSPRISSSPGPNSTPVGTLRNPDPSTMQSEYNTNLSNGSQSVEAHANPIIPPNNTYTASSPDPSKVNNTVPPATPSSFDPISPTMGPEITSTKSTTDASGGTLITKLKASRVLFSAHRKLTAASELANKGRANLAEREKDYVDACAEETRSKSKMEDCDKAIAEAKRAREEAWNKLNSSPNPILNWISITTEPIRKAIVVQRELFRLFSLECTKCVEKLEAKCPVAETFLSNRDKSTRARQDKEKVEKEMEETEKNLSDAKQAFEEAWMKLSSIKE